MSTMNYDLEICTAGSGRHYVEIYALPQRKRIHRTARHDDAEDAVDEARAWLQLTEKQATMTHYAEAVPAA